MARPRRQLAYVGYPVTPMVAHMLARAVGAADRSTTEKRRRGSSRWISGRACVCLYGYARKSIGSKRQETCGMERAVATVGCRVKAIAKGSLHVLAVSMRARDCCMRECRWMCNYYIGGGGRCGLASVHGCTLACMYALLHAGCRTGGLVRTCVCRISKCITRISQCISRAGHAMVPPHSTGLRLAVGWEFR